MVPFRRHLSQVGNCRSISYTHTIAAKNYIANWAKGTVALFDRRLVCRSIHIKLEIQSVSAIGEYGETFCVPEKPNSRAGVIRPIIKNAYFKTQFVRMVEHPFRVVMIIPVHSCQVSSSMTLMNLGCRIQYYHSSYD